MPNWDCCVLAAPPEGSKKAVVGQHNTVLHFDIFLDDSKRSKWMGLFYTVVVCTVVREMKNAWTTWVMGSFS
jgi:hypothetical protein